MDDPKLVVSDDNESRMARFVIEPEQNSKVLCKCSEKYAMKSSIKGRRQQRTY